MTVNHDMNHDSEARHLNHDEIASFAGGSRRQEYTLLEILPGFWPQKRAKIAVLGLIRVSQVTCLVNGFKKSVEITVLGLIRVSQVTWLVAGFEKSVEITVLRLIRVSQENWKLFFVILVKYFIILSNLEAFLR